MVIFERKWEIMDITEKEVYVKWHDYAYRDDLKSAELSKTTLLKQSGMFEAAPL